MSYNKAYMEFVSLLKKNDLKKISDFFNEKNIVINVRPTNYDKITVHYAKDSSLEVIKYCLEEKKGNIFGFFNTLDAKVCINGMEELIAKGLNAQIIYENAFIHACGQGVLEVAHYTAQKNINKHAQNNLALSLACKNNQLESVQYLIENGFEVDEKSLLSSSKRASYYYLVSYPHMETNYTVCSYLLKNYQFKDILSVSDQIVTNLMKEYKKMDSTQVSDARIHEIMNYLIMLHNVPYTNEFASLFNHEKSFLQIFERKNILEKYKGSSDSGFNVNQSPGPAKI
jgi:hypothetical protein